MIARNVALALSTVVAVAACSDSPGGAERTAQTSSAAGVGGTVATPPVLLTPCGVWGGTATQLLVADAVTACSAIPSLDPNQSGPLFRDLPPYSDKYLSNLQHLMTGVVGGNPNEPLASRWYRYRTGQNQCDPTASGSTGKVAITPVTIQQTIVVPTSGPIELIRLMTDADADLRTGPVNLCVAEQLRLRAPGSAGNEALFFSDAEQRELVEVVRERAQVAMLQYALLGEVFALPPTPDQVIPLNRQLRIQELQRWALNRAQQVKALGNDFATAVQLHAIVTQEVGSLFTRDRSARSPRGTQLLPSSLGEEYWGTGSWHHRMMGLFYGGDPLAYTPDAAQLPAASGATTMAVPAPISTVPGTYSGLDWPTAEKQPYFTADVLEPQILDLLRHARHYDLVDLIYAQGGGSCQPFDVAATASAIYSGVEARERVADCYQPSVPGQCSTAAPAPAQADFQSYLLWQKYRITPDHAGVLARYLADAVGPRLSGAACPADPNDAFVGAFDFAGVDATTGSGTLSSRTDAPLGPRLHVSAKASLEQRSLSALAPAFTRLAPFRFPSPSELSLTVDVGGVGFNGRCVARVISGFLTYDCNQPGIAAEAKRTMGAIAAQAAVREMLTSTITFASTQNPPPPKLGDYLANGAGILKAVNGGIGGVTVSVVPQIETFAMTSGGGGQGYRGDGVRVAKRNLRAVVTVDPASTSAAMLAPCKTPGTTCSLAAIQGRYAANLAAHSEASFQIVGGATASLGTLVAEAANAMPPRVANARFQGVNGAPDQFFFEPIPIAQDGAYTLVLQVTGDSGKTTSYLLAGNTLLRMADATSGQYVAVDGALGTWARRQSTMSATNPSEPAFDGFDLPNHWVPPFTAELLGGSPQQSSVEAYMGLAQSSADEASKAVQTAIDGLLQQQQDAAQLQAAIARAQLSLKQDRDSLCGAGNTRCDVSLTHRALDPTWYDSEFHRSCASTDQSPKCVVENLVVDFVTQLMSTNADIAKPVLQQIKDPSAPSFPEYDGGELQAAFIEQWRAIRAPGDRLHALHAALDATKASLDAAAAAFANRQSEADYACSDQAFAGAEEACHSSTTSVGGGLSVPPSISVSFSDSYNPGPLIAQEEKCRSLQAGLPAEKAALVATMKQAFSSMASAYEGLSDTQAAIVQSSAKIHSLLAQADMADARANLDAQLAASTQISSLPLYHRYRDYDMWRAKALLENARRYALAARRAIEARYVVDFTRLNGNEAFVASPSTWADQIYDYDLSMPASVGLVISEPSANGLYTNKVKDYVANMQAFLAGYAANRPAAVAHNDLDVLTLPGFQPGAAVQVHTNPPSTIHPEVGAWNLHCTGTPPQAWVSISPATGDVTTACSSGRPDIARLEFNLDPWGRLNGSISNEPYQKRFNARWGMMALNFVGTGVKDCGQAEDPSGCYSSAFIPYSLRHVGPASVTDYDEFWRTLHVPKGQIEAAKGLAAEVWIDPLRDGWNTSYISAVARTEYEMRPLGGAYELEFAVGPELVLNRIERVQVLVGSSSWVKQQ